MRLRFISVLCRVGLSRLSQMEGEQVVASEKVGPPSRLAPRPFREVASRLSLSLVCVRTNVPLRVCFLKLQITPIRILNAFLS